jgi:hypothetical protein
MSNVLLGIGFCNIASSYDTVAKQQFLSHGETFDLFPQGNAKHNA